MPWMALESLRVTRSMSLELRPKQKMTLLPVNVDRTKSDRKYFQTVKCLFYSKEQWDSIVFIGFHWVTSMTIQLGKIEPTHKQNKNGIARTK